MARRIRKSRAENLRWNQMIEALRLMNFGLNNVRLYPPTHSEVIGTLKRLLETLGPILEETEDVGFGFMDELLYIEGSMSIEETANNQMLVDRLSRCRVKYLTYMKGVSLDDLAALFLILNAESLKPSGVSPGDQLAQKGVQTIHIVEAQVDDLASKSKTGKRKTLYDWYLRALETLKTAQEALKKGPDADLKDLHRFVDDMTATMRNKGCDPYLILPLLGRGLDAHLCHSVNAAIYACALGDAQALNSGQINSLVLHAMLHDLGRVTIPVEWTRDHTPLSAAEKETVRQHTDWGFLLLSRNESVLPQVALSAALHHAPPTDRGLAGAPSGCFPDVLHRILDIADVYDLARLSDKYYWKKHRPERILAAIMDRRGVRFESALVKLLVNCVGFHPIGTLAKLEDGRRGIVVRANPANPSRPKLFMFEEGAEKAPPEPEEPPPVILDTSELDESGLGFRWSIVSNVRPPAGLDIPALIEKKKDYLLSYSV